MSKKIGLAEYNKKRSFSDTPEPKGVRPKKPTTGALHFVVQKHDASHLHYDFRLELDGVLLSWAVPKGPSMNPADKRLAMQTEDHPISYASFEGVIPKGHYGAGDVIVWDRGVYGSPESADAAEARKKIKSGYMKGEIKIVLFGEKLKGGFALVKIKARGGGKDNAWLLIKENDEYAARADITARAESVISGSVLPRDTVGGRKATRASKKTHPKLKGAQGAMPTGIKPMLATLVDEPFDRDDWYFEVKWDGYRAIAEMKGGKVRLYSRNGKAFSYPPILEALKDITHDCVLDGEVIALKNGRADFHTLQQFHEIPADLQYAIFDILWLDGVDLRSQPLSARKALLRKLIPAGHDVLLYSEHTEKFGTKLFNSVKKQGLEGIVAKDAHSPYRDGKRTHEWLKIKRVQEQEAVIVGFTQPRGGRKLFGALVLAAHIKGTLRYIGHSGGGFTWQEMKDLYPKLRKIAVKRSPISDTVPVNMPITWVEPKYVCEIKFTEWTPSGAMRHPIFVGLRIDKKPKDVRREVPEHTPIFRRRTPKKAIAKGFAFCDVPEITHRDKVYWPDEGYTKGDLVEYYDRMSALILPHLIDRPENLNRHPNGITGKNFFQKNTAHPTPDFVRTEKIWSESNNDYINYIVCDNRETLLYLANLGCIEINPWNSRVQNLEKPDYMIFDLDPHGRSMADLARVAQEVRKALDMACEHHVPKTSGKTGIHIYVPLGARYRYEEVKNFAHLIMQIVHKKLPDITSLERTPTKRKGLIYLDYLQNRFGQTIACAYSVRPYPGATVSTPLHWDEIDAKLDPSKFTIRTVEKRIQKVGDLWAPLLQKGVDLHEAIKCLQEHLA